MQGSGVVTGAHFLYLRCHAKMKTEMKDNVKLDMNELEQANGGMLLAGLLIGALVTGTVALFGVAALEDEQKNN